VLLIFWYCHKRGREVRLEKDSGFTESEVVRLEREYEEMNRSDTSTTTARAGATVEGAQDARTAVASCVAASSSTNPSVLGTTVQPAERVGE